VSRGATANGSCTFRPAGTDPTNACGAYTCNGAGSCNTTCSTSVGACATQCKTTAFCHTNGACLPDWDEGQVCLSGSNCECATGKCVHVSGALYVCN
jgi:hypothetical protein